MSHNTQGQIRIGWDNSAAYYAAALEEIAGSKNMTATDKQFAEYLQSIARKASQASRCSLTPNSLYQR